jgi:(R)-2-hydroxyglutarate---pyruvate transhydrogenase
VPTSLNDGCRLSPFQVNFRSGVRSMFSIIRKRWKHTHVYHLNTLAESDIAHFIRILPKNSVLSTLPPTSVSPLDLETYNNDWMGKYRGRATTVLKPQTTDQVSEILKWCSHRRIGVVPQGGNTGLVGGSVPLHDEVIVSMSNMRKIRSFDPTSG